MCSKIRSYDATGLLSFCLTTLITQGLFWFHMNFKTVFNIAVKNMCWSFEGIHQVGTLGGMDILETLIHPVHD